MSDENKNAIEDELSPELRVFYKDGYAVVVIGRVMHSMHFASARELVHLIEDVIDA